MNKTKNNLVDKACLDMKTQAIKDIKSGKYKLFEFGIVSALDTNVQILRRLNIELISGGCIVTEGIECYNSIMENAIRKKFPNEIIEYQSKEYDRIIFKDAFYIQTDFTIIDENTKIITDQLSLMDGLKTGRIIIQIFVDKQGKPVKIEIFKGIDSKIVSILKEKLQKETFKMMTIGKVKVNSILTVPITIK